MKPDPYHYDQTATGWVVHRMVYGNDTTKPDVLIASRETDSEHKSPYEAITRTYELNGQQLAMHPLDALLHLFVTATTETHSGAVIGASLLLGLYNGMRFPFDLTELRRLDRQNYEAAMTAIRFDTPCKMEVHDWLNIITGRSDMGRRFEWMAWRFKLVQEMPDDVQPEPLNLLSPLACE